jgi:MFS family permease
MASLISLRGAQAVPAEYRSTFRHLYLDIAWFGVLSGSAIAFLAVFATRQGAEPWQIGLLGAGPAAVNLIFTLPAGRWLERRPVGPAVFWTSVFHRLFYLPWIFVPVLLLPGEQVWSLILFSLLMSIPGTALAIGFNAMFGAAVPPEWRGHVVGIRNALLAGAFIVTSLVSGMILDRLPFPLGYQVVFAIGFGGAVASSLHLWFVGNKVREMRPPRDGSRIGDLARPGTLRTVGDALRAAVGLRYLARSHGRRLLRPDLLAGPFGVVIGLLFVFHLAQFLAIPVFPLHWVRVLNLTDFDISLGNSLFYLLVLLGSTQLARLTRRWGNLRLTAAGAVAMAAYPLLMALSSDVFLFLVASAVGGLSWALTGGALSNYILERVPADDRPAHLAWYNLALNAAVLIGSLAGPWLGHRLGLAPALLLFAALRLLAALALWRWG